MWPSPVQTLSGAFFPHGVLHWPPMVLPYSFQASAPWGQMASPSHFGRCLGRNGPTFQRPCAVYGTCAGPSRPSCSPQHLLGNGSSRSGSFLGVDPGLGRPPLSLSCSAVLKSRVFALEPHVAPKQGTHQGEGPALLSTSYLVYASSANRPIDPVLVVFSTGLRELLVN